MLHVAFLTIATACFIAGWWQVHRAMQGNTLSYLYSVEWPAFAVVAGIGWWQMFHDTPEDLAERKAHHAKMRAASAEVVARTLPRSARAITVGSAQLEGRALASASAASATDGLESAGARSRTGTELEAGRSQLPVQPFEGGFEATLLEDDAREGPADEMTEYNRYLALLAVRGRAKTWRNPRGL
jgi:hypothetical protein